MNLPYHFITELKTIEDVNILINLLKEDERSIDVPGMQNYIDNYNVKTASFCLPAIVEIKGEQKMHQGSQGLGWKGFIKKYPEYENRLREAIPMDKLKNIDKFPEYFL